MTHSLFYGVFDYFSPWPLVQYDSLLLDTQSVLNTKPSTLGKYECAKVHVVQSGYNQGYLTNQRSAILKFQCFTLLV